MKRLFYILLGAVGVVAIFAFLFYRSGGGERTGSPTVLIWPLQRVEDRPKLLTFGLYVTPDPEQNPIDPPERFTGYHTALDLEIFEEEKNVEVPVTAACSGEVVYAGQAEGYGGVIVHRCVLNNQDITVLYGHIDPSSFAVRVGDDVNVGKFLANLGDGNTSETGDTRKHLHFGIHKGRDIVLLGYVQNQDDLKNYLDPLPVMR